LRLFSFGGYGLALAALALVVFGAIECPPNKMSMSKRISCAFNLFFSSSLLKFIFKQFNLKYFGASEPITRKKCKKGYTRQKDKKTVVTNGFDIFAQYDIFVIFQCYMACVLSTVQTVSSKF